MGVAVHEKCRFQQGEVALQRRLRQSTVRDRSAKVSSPPARAATTRAAEAHPPHLQVRQTPDIPLKDGHEYDWNHALRRVALLRATAGEATARTVSNSSSRAGMQSCRPSRRACEKERVSMKVSFTLRILPGRMARESTPPCAPPETPTIWARAAHWSIQSAETAQAYVSGRSQLDYGKDLRACCTHRA